MSACPVDKSSLSTTSELLQGMIIRGRYEIMEKIGAGGMASVYRARHLHFDEVRAIKVVRSFMSEDENFLRRLRSEAVISRKLQHPNAVRVDDLDALEDGRPFIVMEYVEGPDLRQVIKDTGPMPLRRVVTIGSQIAAALGAAHRLRIIHRDIKPDNIRLVQQPDGSETVKVLDFGIAKLQGATSQSGAGSLTMTGMVVCTPDYASPEQARGGNSSTLDGRSDLYSLGIVMYEMLTGELPFHSDTPIGMLLAQISTTPRLPSDIRPELNIPEAMSEVLMKCLEKDPADRFQTADELIEALEEIESGTLVGMPVVRQVLTMRKRVALPEPEPVSSVEEPNLSTAAELTSELRQAERRGQVTRRVMMALAVVLVIAGLGFFLRARWFQPHASSQPATTTSANGPRTDAEILADVRRAVTSIKGGDKIAASVNNGEVSLSGEVPSPDAIEAAALRAARVSGVASVDRSSVRVAAPTQTAAALPQSAAPVPPSDTYALDHRAPTQLRASGPLPASASDPPIGQPSESTTTQASQPYREKPEVLQLLAQARQARDQETPQFDKALIACDAALRLDPNSPAARREKQITQKAKKWYDENNQ